ncbi:MAG: CPBP family intramembrane metalloprotease [Tannerella sp.]|jgi:membrane protease YdiL (CAAX protease family)|nr:CPBP family intramembrane metalloprotease [Tannerella sp.]
MKGVFSNRSTGFQLGVLTYLFLFGLIAGSVITFVVDNSLSGMMTTDPAGGNTRNPSFYRIHAVQFISSLFIFLLPAIGVAYLCGHSPGKFLHFRRISDLRIFLLTALMVVLISPTIDITSYLNQKIQLPEWMSPAEEWMRETEENITRLTDNLLSEKGILPFIINLFIIAVMAGLTEEILFRGALLSMIRKKTANPHLAIWIVAIIFSAIHFQFYGFIPRILLGIFLGYLLYWTDSIWAPIFAHFLNNAMIVAGSYLKFFPQPDHSLTSGGIPEMETKEMITTIAIAIAGLLLFAICVKMMIRIARPKQSEIKRRT